MTPTLTDRRELKEQVLGLIGDDLNAVNAILEAQFRSPGMFVQDVADHVRRFQGKQIRPVLTLLAARACQVQERHLKTARQLAAVVEMIHTATLVHDDVIDDAELRRHVATVHRRWNTETSVLFGDYLLSRAFHLAARTGDAEACRLIGLATDRTCEGELNQIAARLEQSTSERDYFRIIGGKTGQLFAVSCELGARSAGADRRQQVLLRQYGLRVGLVFQIADDVLDLIGSADRTGKDSANDLANHRRTLPILRALRLAPKEEAGRLMDLLQSAEPGMHRRLCRDPLIREGIASATATADAITARAIAGLRKLPASPARSALEAIANFAAHRPG